MSYNEQQFRSAIQKSDFTIISSLLLSGFKLNSYLSNGRTPLIEACRKGSPETVRRLINLGCDINKPSLHFGNTALLIAIRFKRIKIIKLLLKHNCDVDLVNVKGWNSLFFAVKFGLLNIVKILLEKNKMDLNQCDHKGRRLFNITSNRAMLNYLAENNKTFEQDFLRLYELKEQTDFVIQTIPVHQTLLELRLHNNINIIDQICSSFPKNHLEIFFRWVYGGVIENEKIVFSISQQFGIVDLSSRNLITDIKSLYHQEKNEIKNSTSKTNFTIFVGEKTIQVHKIVLQARSDLFRCLFLNILGNTNHIKDCSGNSLSTLKTIIHFLYTDTLESFDTDLTILKKELNDAVDYYQLNENSKLHYLL
ncbi:ankyrin repeat-containing protein [Anaeramoeba flamelloides]|uniref:Ankyrin repeat-containing protein n=1 Tax=Anaeramoeba flamelloides TaxID=1746091 RepID=A0ABQ8Z9H8_9EUKA|nr:ankyrin repeat-containing protein [Anaeramoeba flamelloides]